MKFSERKGYVEPKKVIQSEGVDEETRNAIWNILDAAIFSTTKFRRAPRYERPGIIPFARQMWMYYFNAPMDTVPPTSDGVYNRIREYFFSCEWYEFYDFLEYILGNFGQDEVLINLVNGTLEKHLAGYRYSNGIITDITDPKEIQELENALSYDDFPGVQEHLQTSLKLLSDRKNPDYRNSIKESISAVESACQHIAGNPKATLGDALKELKKSGKLHPALERGFSSLYGYTNVEDGIRHAMLDEPNLVVADAKYFLITCSTFINYLKSKLV